MNIRYPIYEGVYRILTLRMVRSGKGHTYFFEAKVAVPHRSARPGPAGRRGKIILTLCAPVFFPAEP